MRVLLVCHGYPPDGVAGVERLSAQAAAALTARGHAVTVLTRRPCDHPPTLTLERDLRDGVPVISVAGGGMRFDQVPEHEPTLERIFERVIVEVVPDVVLITHFIHHSPGYVAVAHRWRVPVVLELHDFFALCHRGHLQRRSGELCAGPEGGAACATHCFSEQPDARLRWVLRTEGFRAAVRSAEEVVVPSRFLAGEFAPVRGEGASIQVIDSAIPELGEVSREEAPPGGPLRLASIGVTVEHKGFQVVLEALRLAGLPEVTYTILGRVLPPQAPELREAAAEVQGLRLRMFGEFSPSHLPSLLADVDALIVPSVVAETYSIVTREAFACGVPVLASRIGALPDAIRDGENGWLFSPGDAAELAALLRGLSDDRSLLRRAAAGIRAEDVVSVAQRTDRLEALLEGVRATSASA